MIDYPQKGSHYAHKTFRLMHKAMVAAEYGRDVMCLLAVILHTEDAARYRGPVSFFNTQLMETLGFKKWDQFDAVRTKAVESGWLQYEGCGKRTPGKYFVTIPEGFEQVDDGLMEECISPKNGYNDGYNDGYKQGYDEGVKVGINRGQTRVTSYPIPNPVPNPIPTPPIFCSEPSASKQNDVDERYSFQVKGGSRQWSCPKSLLEKFESTYDNIDVHFQLRAAMLWIESKPERAKTSKNMPAFLNGWLARAVNNPKSPRRKKELTQEELDDPILRMWNE